MTGARKGHPGRIDVHHHILPQQYVAALKSAGITGTTGIPFPDWRPSQALKFMDRNGIAASVLSISSPGATVIDRSSSRDIARLCNETLAQLVADYPGRFGALAVLPLFDMDDALEELSYALDTLQLDGVALLSNTNGAYLGDPFFDRLFGELDRRSAVVHVHPTDPPAGGPASLEFANALVESPFDTTRAVANMVFNGTLDRFPNVRIILAHGGGTTPYLAWKIALQEYSQKHKKLRSKAIYDFVVTKRGPKAGTDALARLYYDTALAANPFALRSLQELVDTSHILFGTDYCWAQAWMTPLFIRALREYDGFTDEDLLRVERDSALSLFPRLASSLE